MARIKHKIAVLIALYKSKEFLTSKIESIKRQTAFEDALFIFLNCQDDDCEAPCKELLKSHRNIRHVYFNEHVSLYQSWNHGIIISNTEYICNYNADDQWHPEFLEKCINELDRDDSTSVLSTGVLVTDLPNQLWPEWNYQDKMPKHVYPLSSPGPSPVWRRSLHKKYGNFGNYHVIGDARFWEKCYANGEKFGIIRDDLVLYFRNPNSLERRRCNQTGDRLLDIDLTR